MKRLNQKGQGTTEYVVIVAILVVIAFALKTTFGPAISSQISSIASQIGTA